VSWIDAYFTGYTIIQVGGANLPQEGILNFVSGAQVTDDAKNGRTNVVIMGGGSGGGSSIAVTGTGFWFSESSSLNPAAITVDGDVSQGVLFGNAVELTVTGIQGRTISTATPLVNDVLTWSGTQWYGAPSSGGSAPSVVGTGFWFSASSSLHTAAVTLDGDVSQGAISGSNVPITVTALQGRAVANTAPTTSYVLTWNGSAWAPAASSVSGITQLTADVTAGPGAGSVAATVVALQGTPLNAIGPTTGNALVYSGFSWYPTAFNEDATLSGSGAVEVVGILTHALPSLSTGYLNWSGSAWQFTSGSSIITWSSDLGSSTDSNQWVGSISGYANSGTTCTLKIQTLVQSVNEIFPYTANILTVASGGGYSTLNTSGAANTLALNAGSAVAASSGTAVGGAGGTFEGNGGAGANGVGGNSNGGVGGGISLQAGAGGNAAGSGTGGAAGSVFIGCGNPGSGSADGAWGTFEMLSGNEFTFDFGVSGANEFVLDYGITEASTFTATLGDGASNVGIVQAQNVTPSFYPSFLIASSSGAGGASASGPGSALNITAGSGTTASGGSASGAVGGALIFTSGTGAAGFGTNRNGGNGGNVVVNSGGGGAKTGSGTAGTAGTISLEINSTPYLVVSATGTVTLASLGTGIVQSNGSGLLTSGTISVSNLPFGTAAQILNTNSGGTAAQWVTISGDSTITASGVMTNTALQTYAVSNSAPSSANIFVYHSSAWTPTAVSGDVSISSTGVTTVGAIQGNTVTSGALTKGQFFVATSTSNWAATSLSGDVSESGSTAGLLTVVALQGNAVANTSPSNGYVLAWNSGTSKWTPTVLPTLPSVTGTGLWYSSSGSLNSAAITLDGDVSEGALSGSNVPLTVTGIQGNTVSSGALTEGQFLVATSTSNWAATSLSGDVAESNSTPGKLTVVGLYGYALANTAPTPNYILTWSGSSWGPAANAGSITWANDLSSSTNTNQYVSGISGSSGTAGTVTLGDGTHNLSLTGVTSLQSTPPTISLSGSAGYAAAGTAGAGSPININGGNGATASSGTSTGGAGGALTISAGGGGNGEGTSQNGGVGGGLILGSGSGGVATSGGTNGATGKITLWLGSATPEVVYDLNVTTASTLTILHGDGASNVAWTSVTSTQTTAPTLSFKGSTGYQAASTSGTGGPITLTSGSGTAASSGTVAGANGGNLTVTSGTGAAGLGGNSNGGNGGNVVINTGAGGAKVGSGTAGTAGTISLEINSTTYLGIGATGAVTLASLGLGVVLSSSVGLLSNSNGTSTQLLIGQTSGGPTWNSVSGDATLSAAGSVDVTGLLTHTLPSLTTGYLNWTGSAWALSAAGGGVTWASDLSGNGTSTSTNQYVSSLSYSSASAGGTIAINGTGTDLAWASGNTTPNFFQTALASTSSGSGAAGNPFSIVAQAGQAATGASNNGGAGGALILGGGAGGTSGSATAGAAGEVQIQTGGTTRFSVDFGVTTANKITYLLGVVASNAVAVNMTVPTPTGSASGGGAFIFTNSSGAASSTSNVGGGSANTLNFVSGNGGAGNGSGAGGTGGNYEATSGTGGAGGASGAGGAAGGILFFAGTGGTGGATSGNGGAGGYVYFSAGGGGTVTSGTNGVGGSVALVGGAAGGGSVNNGSVQLGPGGTNTMLIEAAYIANSQRVVAFNRLTSIQDPPAVSITSTQVPSGDGVIWVGNAHTNPTITNGATPPASGFMLWATSGFPNVMVPGPASAQLLGQSGSINTQTNQLTKTVYNLRTSSTGATTIATIAVAASTSLTVFVRCAGRLAAAAFTPYHNVSISSVANNAGTLSTPTTTIIAASGSGATLSFTTSSTNLLIQIAAASSANTDWECVVDAIIV
jgi:hypothetical protein